MTARTLLLVTPYFPPAGGGLEHYAQRIGEELATDFGWRVVVATSGSSRTRTTHERVGSLDVHRLPTQLRVSNTPVGITWRRELRRIIRRYRPDVVNAHAPVPGLADIAGTLRREVPFVLTYHAGAMHKGRPLADAAVASYEATFGRYLLDHADWIIASSDFVRDTYLARVRAKCTTITPGVDTGRFHPAPTRPPDRLLFVGGLNHADRHKGLDTLLGLLPDLVADHPGVTLDVVGAGDELEHWQARCNATGIAEHVRFRGRLGGDELADAYRQAGCLVLPTRNDSHPMVLLEAMATGLPVISTTVGAISQEVTSGRHGLLVDPEDEPGLRAAVADVLDDPTRADAMGLEGRAHVIERFGWSRLAAATDQVLGAVAGGATPDHQRRIAVVSPYFHPRIGGLENYARQLAGRLEQSGDHEVIVVTSNHEDHRNAIEIVDDVTVFRLPTWVRVSNTPMSAAWVWHLRRILRANRIDLVNVHTPVPFMAESAALAAGRRPLAVTYHAGSMAKQQPLVDALVGQYEQRVLPRLLRRADAVVAVSPFVRDTFLGAMTSDVELIAPGVDLDLFTPAPPGEEPDPPTVLFVGRIDHTSAWKGIDHLLDAFAVIHRARPDARLDLVGDGDAIDAHRQHARRLGIESGVRFWGSLTGAALVDRYRGATVVVLPSVSEAESFGMTLIEAMACGRPVIGSDIGGIPTVIAHEIDGLVTPPGDPAALAAACLRLLDDPDLARQFGRNGRAKVRADYGWPSRVAAYEKVFQTLTPDR